MTLRLALLAVAIPSFAAAQAMPPMPKPGPEHAMLTADAGTWDATVESFMSPDGKPMVSKGTETNTVGCGGLCLVSQFKGEMMPGMSFEGNGLTVYDTAKKKYVGSWSDSMSGGMLVGESTWDPATKSLTGYMEGPDMTGQVTKSKAVVQHKDANTRVFTMYASGPGGKEMQVLRITYTRRK